MVKLVDTLDLGSSAERCAGSSPAPSTKTFKRKKGRKLGKGTEQKPEMTRKRIWNTLTEDPNVLTPCKPLNVFLYSQVV